MIHGQDLHIHIHMDLNTDACADAYTYATFEIYDDWLSMDGCWYVPLVRIPPKIDPLHTRTYSEPAVDMDGHAQSHAHREGDVNAHTDETLTSGISISIYPSWYSSSNESVVVVVVVVGVVAWI